MPAVDFALLGIDGKTWTLQQCKGDKGALVMFTCNHWPYVQAVQERIVRDTRALLDHGIKSVAVMRHNPANPRWRNRDRFVMSNGHASMLLVCPTAPERLRCYDRRPKALSATAFPHAVVSMPSTQVFDAQDRGYREAVLPPEVRTRIAIEAGATDFWFKYVGMDGRVIGLDSFGESAPAEEVLRHFGFNVDHVIEEVRRLLA